MKSISYWALLHPRIVWILLILFHTCLALGAFELGIWLSMIGVGLSNSIYWSGMGLFLLSAVLYPVRRSRYKLFKWSYTKQKCLDLSLVLGGILMMTSMSNRVAWEGRSLFSDQEARVVQVAVYDPVPRVERSNGLSELIKKGFLPPITKWYRSQVEKRLQARTDQSGWLPHPVWIIVLMVILLQGIVILSCAIGCSSAGAWALLPLIGGTTLILIFGIKWYRHYRTKWRLARSAG